MNEKEIILAMYNKYSEQLPALFDRRQAENRFFIGIFLALYTATGWMLLSKTVKFEPLYVTYVAAFVSILLSFSWFASLLLYLRAMRSTFAVLKEMEKTIFTFPYL
jgi:hypothetical protein